MRYVILERTPFPGDWKPMAICYLQEAEFALFDQRYYYERALPVGGLLLYTLHDAEQIIKHRHARMPQAEHRLFGYWQAK